MKTSFSVLPLLLLLLAACGPHGAPASGTKEAWNSQNDPLKLRGDYERTLAELPLEGELATIPWSDTYWPSYQAGISNRWRTDEDSFKYDSPNLERLRAMTLAERSNLSPAEKFDALLGRYDYPTVQGERQRTNKDKPHWEGICHGWAPAAINFDEPKPVTVAGANGISIPFGSSDVKALLSFYEGQVSSAPSRMLGGRCNIDLAEHPEAASNPECRDTNAGAFHIVLVNQLGVLKQGFVADVTRDFEVWNQPVHGFTAKLINLQEPSEGAARGTVQEAVFETTMRYTVEIYPTWDAVNGTRGHADDKKVYKYRVELNAAGQVIGGEWLSDERPDFLWTQARPRFAGYWGPLGDLYQKSLDGPVQPDL